MIDEKWLLSALESSFQKQFGLSLGDEIISVDGVSMENLDICVQQIDGSLFSIKSQITGGLMDVPYQNLLLN